MIDIKGKNIVVIMPFFYDYHNMIRDSLTKKGANVYLFNDNVETLKLSYKFIYSVPFISTEDFLRKYYKKLFLKLPEHIDILLVVKGTSLRNDIIDQIKNCHPECHTILYEWDSTKKFPGSIALAPCFDRCLTFDSKDSEEFGWAYRPLFFEKEIDYNKGHRKYDYSFVGSLHSERAKVVSLMDDYCKINGLSSFLFLYSRRAGYLHQKYLNKNKSFDVPESRVHFKPLSKKDTDQVYEESVCVVDYQSTDQTGLTIRSIEALGHGCKLLTNNAAIKAADFYDPDNIYIYNLDFFEIPSDFLKTEYHDVDMNIYHRYTVDGFIADLLEE